MENKETKKSKAAEETSSENAAKVSEKDSVNKDTPADPTAAPEQNETTGSCDGACSETGCTCGHCGDTEGKDDPDQGDDKEESRGSFFDELRKLAEKYGGHVVSGGTLIGGPIPFPNMPRCANADTCEHADTCRWAQGEPEETEDGDHDGPANPSEFEIILGALDSFSHRLSHIEDLLEPKELAEQVAMIGEFKSPKIRKKDIKRISKKVAKKVRKTVRDIVEDEMEDCIYSIRATICSEMEQKTSELKEYISQMHPITQFPSTPSPKIEMPRPGWGMNEWINFQRQLTQIILSSKMNPECGKQAKR